MNQPRKTRKKSSRINRREFCKTVPCAAIGVLSLSSFQSKSLKEANASATSKETLTKKEESMDKKITAVVAKVKSIKGTCGLGHKVGDETKFTEAGIEGKICIHALYSMLPAVFAMMYEARFPWLKDPDVKTHACPDAANPVVFEITRIREN